MPILAEFACKTAQKLREGLTEFALIAFRLVHSVPCSCSPFKILNIRATKVNIKYFERRHSMWTNAYSYEDIGEFLREARRARGITQIEMAKKLGFSSVTLSALETGKNVSAVKVDRYLQQLGFRMVIVPKGADVEVAE